MSKLFALTKRNLKEIIRDPLSLVFCLIFPVVMLVLLQLVLGQVEFMPENFKIENYAVGICVFGYTFSMLFVAMLISSDKNTEFINKIKIAPVSKWAYLFSYVLAMLPIMFVQTAVFFAISLVFGLPFSANLLIAFVYLLPSAVLYISFGILFGTLAKNEKQAGPICAIVISLASVLGGVFMPISNLGNFSKVVNLLPFSHSVEIASGLFQNNFACIYPHILWVIGYIVALWLIIFFLQKKKN
jgi:ABC-2 type transport system permease protein